jgi:hypothetical protein
MRSRGIGGVPPGRSSPRSSRRACKRRRTIRARRSAAARGQPRPTRTVLPARPAEARSRARGTAIPPARWPAAVDVASRPRSALMLTNSTSRGQGAIAATAARRRRRPSASATGSGAAVSEYPTWGLGGCRSTRFRHLTISSRARSKITTRRIGPQIRLRRQRIRQRQGCSCPVGRWGRPVRRCRRGGPAAPLSATGASRGWLARADRARPLAIANGGASAGVRRA